MPPLQPTAYEAGADGSYKRGAGAMRLSRCFYRTKRRYLRTLVANGSNIPRGLMLMWSGGGETRGARRLVVPRERASRETTMWYPNDCREIGTFDVSVLGTAGSCPGHQRP